MRVFWWGVRDSGNAKEGAVEEGVLVSVSLQESSIAAVVCALGGDVMGGNGGLTGEDGVEL
jgi:hypothetical protein